MITFEIIASIASIISIPLAIYYARKTNNTTIEKARLDILKTLSYRLSSTYSLTFDDIDSVYKSKLREHKITKAKFTQEDLLNDLKTDVMSNAFLAKEIKNDILYNLSMIQFDQKENIYTINRIWKPLITLFVSPLPLILFVAILISCFILLCPYIIDLFLAFYDGHYYHNYIMRDFIIYIYEDIILRTNLILLLIFCVICWFRKRFLKQKYSFI